MGEKESETAFWQYFEHGYIEFLREKRTRRATHSNEQKQNARKQMILMMITPKLKSQSRHQKK